ncbi:MAG: Lrp/AsnC ligand binding domain-containing protein [Chloroflexi bacterium]|nr:Lrp/AsnC ligand binding domain-containing protein [Chloroflexota bacterium]
MQLKQVLAAVPGLPKRFVYYLESLGYIKPRKVPKARIARRDYSAEDLQLLRSIWRYYQRGFSLQHAYKQATKESHVVTYVALAVPVPQQRQVVERLRGQEEVEAAAAVYGESFGLIAKWRTAEEHDLYPFLVSLLREAGLTSIPAVWKADERFRRAGRKARKGVHVRAYVLLKIPGTSADRILQQLRAFSGITEAGVVYGETDIVAKVEVGSQEELDRLVMEQVHGIPGVESTRTYIVVGGLHWSRDVP